MKDRNRADLYLYGMDQQSTEYEYQLYKYCDSHWEIKVEHDEIRKHIVL